MNNKLSIGQQVLNFGVRATVINFHPVTGDPILQNTDGQRWVADATKCEAVRDRLQHCGGLAVFD